MHSKRPFWAIPAHLPFPEPSRSRTEAVIPQPFRDGLFLQNSGEDLNDWSRRALFECGGTSRMHIATKPKNYDKNKKHKRAPESTLENFFNYGY